MPGKKQITAKNAKHTKKNRGFFLAVTMQFMGAMSDEDKQLLLSQLCSPDAVQRNPGGGVALCHAPDLTRRGYGSVGLSWSGFHPGYID